MRLIDMDVVLEYMDAHGISKFEITRESIEKFDNVDAIPVVRCKDCKWCEAYGYSCVCHNPRYGDGYANYQPPHINDEYWCADGERKDNE